jgi:hypothetical protein
MLYTEINAVCSQIHTKHINTRFEQNVEFLGALPKLWKAISYAVPVHPHGIIRLPLDRFS